MRTEKMLENIMRITEAIKVDACAVALMDCDKLIGELTAEINARTAMQTGQKDIFAAAVKIMKSGAKENPVYASALTMKDGSQIVMDACRAVKFSTPLNLPHSEDTQNYKAEILADNINNLISRTAKQNDEKITLPAVTELKNFIATETSALKAQGRKTKTIIYALALGIRVEAHYLLDLLRALPGAVMFANTNAVTLLREPLYLKAENGSGIILPLLIKDDYRRTK